MMNRVEETMMIRKVLALEEQADAINRLARIEERKEARIRAEKAEIEQSSKGPGND